MRTFILLSLIACAGLSTAQVRIDQPLVLGGATAAERQVTGLDPSLSPGATNTAAVEQSGAHRYATATTTWEVNIPSLSAPPAPGTQIVIGVPEIPGSGAVLLTVNDQGPYVVFDTPGDTLKASAAVNRPLLSLVFDGTAFHLLNGPTHVRRDCPSGLVAVNSQYCIEPNERDSTDWYEAARTCVAQGLSLCGWGEWHGACSLAATLGLFNMTGDWEWTDDSANEDEVVRIVGDSNCAQGSTWPATGNAGRKFRCCYKR